jgi:hypothetical protein
MYSGASTDVEFEEHDDYQKVSYRISTCVGLLLQR